MKLMDSISSVSSSYDGKNLSGSVNNINNANGDPLKKNLVMDSYEDDDDNDDGTNEKEELIPCSSKQVGKPIRRDSCRSSASATTGLGGLVKNNYREKSSSTPMSRKANSCNDSDQHHQNDRIVRSKKLKESEILKNQPSIMSMFANQASLKENSPVNNKKRKSLNDSVNRNSKISSSSANDNESEASDEKVIDELVEQAEKKMKLDSENKDKSETDITNKELMTTNTTEQLQLINHPKNKFIVERCTECGQILDEQEIVMYPGDSGEAVEEFVALTDSRLSLFTGDEQEIDEADERPQHRLTNFSVYDRMTHLCPFDSGLLEKNVELYFSGYIKPIYDDNPSIEGGICTRNMGPINQWWTAGFDGGEVPVVGFSTAFAEYILLSPSDAYKPFWDAVSDKTQLSKVVIEFLKESIEKDEQPSYEDLVNRIQLTVPRRCTTSNNINFYSNNINFYSNNINFYGNSNNNHSGLLQSNRFTEDSLLQHAQFIIDQLQSYDDTADTEDVLLIIQPCIRTLVKLTGVTLGRKNKSFGNTQQTNRKTRQQQQIAAKTAQKKKDSKATVTPLVREVFDSLFKGQIEGQSSAATKRRRCGVCEACQMPDCGKCRSCMDMIKFGGSGRSKQACLVRRCPYMSIKEAEDDDLLDDNSGEISQNDDDEEDDVDGEDDNDDGKVKGKKRKMNHNKNSEKTEAAAVKINSVVHKLTKVIETKVTWIGSPLVTKYTNGEKIFYLGAYIGEHIVKIGDHVCVRPDDPAVPMYVAQVRSMWQEVVKRSNSCGKAMFHARWLNRGGDTVLGETSDPRELFLVDECQDSPLHFIAYPIKVDYVIQSEVDFFGSGGGASHIPGYQTQSGLGRGDDKGSSDNNDDGKSFFCRLSYDQSKARFEDFSEFDSLDVVKNFLNSNNTTFTTTTATAAATTAAADTTATTYSKCNGCYDDVKMMDNDDNRADGTSNSTQFENDKNQDVEFSSMLDNNTTDGEISKVVVDGLLCCPACASVNEKSLSETPFLDDEVGVDELLTKFNYTTSTFNKSGNGKFLEFMTTITSSLKSKTFYRSLRYKNDLIKQGDCIYLDTEAYDFKLSTNNNNNSKKQIFTKVLNNRIIKYDEDVYPELYRKTEYIKGSNEQVPEPFRIALVVGFFVKTESNSYLGQKSVNGKSVCNDVRDDCGPLELKGRKVKVEEVNVVVQKFYRPENTNRGNPSSHNKDLNLLYWSEDRLTVSFRNYTGKCTVTYFDESDLGLQATDVLTRYFNDGSDRFYFTEMYIPGSKSLQDVPSSQIVKELAFYKGGGKGKGKNKNKSSLAKQENVSTDEKKPLRALKCLDVFAGCGGLSEGLHQAGIADTRWAIEKDESASQAFRLNNPSCTVFSDDCNELLSLAISGSEFNSTGQKLPKRGDVELLCGGPPCQGFSGMNRFNQREYSKFKNSLIASYLSYCDYYRPKYFLLENVRNFVSFKRGVVLKLALRCLISMGYQCTFGVLQAGCYGIPQTRRRAIILASAPGYKLPFYPEPMHSFSVRGMQLTVAVDGRRFESCVSRTSGSAPFRTITVRDAMSDLPEVNNGAGHIETGYGGEPVSHFQKMSRRKIGENSYTTLLQDHVCKEMSALVLARMQHIPLAPGSDWRDLPNLEIRLKDGTVTRKLRYTHDDKRVGKTASGNLRGVCSCVESGHCDPAHRQFNTLIPWCLPHTGNRHNHWSGLYGRLEWDGFFSTTVTNPEPMGKQGRVLHPEQHRVVTVRECARSQGFPDTYRFYGTVLDRHRQVGNAVPPPMARHIGFEIKKSLQLSLKKKENDKKP